EIAHHWFGNSVTPAWWDDIWLAESLATWATDEVLRRLGQLNPSLSREGSLQTEQEMAAAPLRMHIESDFTLRWPLSTVQYGKGVGLLETLSAWLGRDVVRRGLMRYLAAHASSSATSADLEAAISQEAGRDVAPVMESFLKQPGYPVVFADFACD